MPPAHSASRSSSVATIKITCFQFGPVLKADTCFDRVVVAAIIATGLTCCLDSMLPTSTTTLNELGAAFSLANPSTPPAFLCRSISILWGVCQIVS